MLQMRDRSRLGREPRQLIGVRMRGIQNHFQRHLAVEYPVACQVHDTHSTATQFTPNVVYADRFGEPFWRRDFSHRRFMEMLMEFKSRQ
jgi:hypothetical protein